MSQQKLTPIQQYRQTMLGLNRQQPISQASLAQRVADLQMLSANRPKKDIFDMASSLGGGLTRQAQSGRPSSIGYGLSMGFGDFNDQINKNKELAEQEAQQLRMMAYEELKAERERARKIEETVAQNIFETETSALEEATSGLFGSSFKGQLMEILRKVFTDPSFANTPEYSLAFNELEKDKFTTDPISGGTVRTKGMDLVGMGFPEPGSYGKSTTSQQPTTGTTAGAQGKLNLPQGDPEYNVTYTTQQMLANGPYAGKKSPAGKPVYISGYKNGQPTFTDTP